MAKDVDKFEKRFAEAVKKLRKDKGLSHEKLAIIAGVTRPTIANIESCKKSPTLATCYKVAKSLGVNLSDLVEEAE